MAGETTARISRSVSVGGVTIGGTQQSVLTDGQVTLSKVVPGNTTDGRFNVTVDVSETKVMAIETSKDCTVETNSASSPSDTLALKANIPLIWVVGDAAAAFLTVDVTALYVTTGTDDTTLKFVAAIDTTPVLP